MKLYNVVTLHHLLVKDGWTVTQEWTRLPSPPGKNCKQDKFRWRFSAGDAYLHKQSTQPTPAEPHTTKPNNEPRKTPFFTLSCLFTPRTHTNFHIRQLTLLAHSLRPRYPPPTPSGPHLSTCGRINVSSYSVVNRQPAVHHLNQSSQPSAVTPGSTPIPDTAPGKCLPRRKRERGIKSVSIIFQRAA